MIFLLTVGVCLWLLHITLCTCDFDKLKIFIYILGRKHTIGKILKLEKTSRFYDNYYNFFTKKISW